MLVDACAGDVYTGAMLPDGRVLERRRRDDERGRGFHWYEWTLDGERIEETEARALIREAGLSLWG